MYIKQLSANKNSFNSITFQNSSLNIILGSKSKEGNNSKTTTTVNGVGKTLSIKLIDYCLGSRLDAHKELKKLNDWIFELNICHNDRNYNLQRAVGSGEMWINGKNKKSTQVTSMLEAEFFIGVEDYRFLSFRNLISRYLRIPKKAYQSWEKYKSGEDEDKSLLYNSFLLGLDIELIINKILIKSAINDIDKSKSYLKKDPTIKSIMNGSDMNIELKNLVKEITKLENNISSFKISEGYNDIQKAIEADKYLKNNVINQLSKYHNMISRINDNLAIRIDITSTKVLQVYNEANIVFSENVVKEFNEISSFHEKLLETRKARLIDDKKKYKKKIENLESELMQLDVRVNSNLDFIKDKVSTSEYERLQEKLVGNKIQLEKMKQYSSVLKELELSKASKQAELASDNIKAIQYIESKQEFISSISNQFQEYVEYIYGETKYSGFDIKNNEKENKIRYNINVEIQNDDSGGIGNVKLFCMDLLLWERQINNSVDFLYHDGLLFSEVDPRQCYRMLKLAHNICTSKKRQYICNMNYDMFDSILSVADSEKDIEFISIVRNSIVKELYDDRPERKLLGIQMK